MSVFVQVLGWIAFMLGVVLILFGLTANETFGPVFPADAGEYAELGRVILSLVLFPVGLGLIFNGAMLIVFGEMAGDIRKMRRLSETK